MTIDLDTLRVAIAERRLADWVLTERRRRAVTSVISATSARDSLWRRDDRDRLRVLVRRDLPGGRGTGIIELQERRGDPRAVIAQAVACAEAAIAAPWITPLAAAPARVELLDATVATSLDAAAAALTATLQRGVAEAELELVTAELRVARDEVTLGSAQGFELAWRESWFELAATVRRDGALALVRRRARRIAELDLPTTLRALARDLTLPTASAAVPAHPVVLELGIDAMLGDDERGVWRAITEEADARDARLGLTRHRPGATLAVTDDPLTVWSDGALDYGTRSAPIGEDGEAVRRFRLVADGVLGEPGMGPQDAALRGRAPNGGVRNLVVSPGNAAAARDDAATRGRVPIVEVRQLRWLHLDAASGEAEAELALGIDRDTAAPLRGGRFTVDLLHALATATRAPERVRRGAYLGPAWIRLGPLSLR